MFTMLLLNTPPPPLPPRRCCRHRRRRRPTTPPPPLVWSVPQCPDGIFAALALHLAHRARGLTVDWRPNTVYAPLTVEALQLRGDETAFLLDFSGGRGFAAQLAQHAARVVVLDHHKTAAAELLDPELSQLPALEVQFDMGRSGATIRWGDRPSGMCECVPSKGCMRLHTRVLQGEWEGLYPPPRTPTRTPSPSTRLACLCSYDYFQPKGLTHEQRMLFRYIEDADLWRWALPDSRAFTAGLTSLALEYDARLNPAIFDTLLQQTPGGLIEAGRAVLERQQRLVAEASAAAFSRVCARSARA